MQISQYEIIKEIHYGNLAESYIAANSDGEQVYLKRLILKKAQEELRLRFPLEIQALRDLKGHANVCSILDAGEDSDGNPFFVTEFVDGFNLEERLSDPDRRFSLENVRQIILSILSVLDYSHNRTQSYIHRDIKPSNIIMTHDCSDVKLIDFGIVHVDSSNITKRPIGTIDYMPPECWDPNGQVDERSDLWSAGVLMYKLLTDKIPYNGSPELAQKNPMITLPSSMRPWIPVELDDVVLKSIERDPSDRYQSAIAFQEAVEQVFFQISSAFNPEIDALAQTLRKLAFRDQEKDVLMLLSNHAHLISSIEAAAKRDHLESQWLLGMCHNYGIGIEQSVEAALTWLEIAGQAGHVASQYYFALLQDRSQVAVNENQKLAIAQWYAYAAQGGYAPAQYKLGISKWADAATQDHKEAFQWFKKSADQNYIPAYSTLATCYEHGWGTAIDVEEAVRLYRIAVNESHAPSMHHLGRILTKGAQGIQRDKTNGEKYMQHAAELGFEEVETKVRSDATVIMSH